MDMSWKLYLVVFGALMLLLAPELVLAERGFLVG